MSTLKMDDLVVVKYDEDCRNWSSDDGINQMFVRTVHNYMLDRLRARGHVFLNEAFDELGLPRTKQGQTFGWILKEDQGDLWDGTLHEGGVVLLAFTTDGDILDQIEEWR